MGMSNDLLTGFGPDEEEGLGFPSSTSKGQLISLPEADAGSDAVALEAMMDEVCDAVAPLWGLNRFVATHPYLGMLDRPFSEAMAEVDQVHHARGLMPIGYFESKLARGRIGRQDLRLAIEDAPRLLARPELEKIAPDDLMAMLLEPCGDEEAPRARVLTVADALDREAGSRFAEHVELAIARFCAGRFDGGQAAWKQPDRDRGLFEAWRSFARLDRSHELKGIEGFRAFVEALPATPLEVIAAVLDQLAISAHARPVFLARQLASISGWAGHLRRLAWESGLRDESENALPELLAIRLAFDGAIAAAKDELPSLLPVEQDEAGAAAGAALDRIGLAASEEGLPELSIAERGLLWQAAFEASYRNALLERLESGAPDAGPASPEKALVQAVFCIDVRSEVLRRHLESLSPRIETRGFAGFFGAAIEWVEAGDEAGGARCPALLAPGIRVREKEDDPGRLGLRMTRERDRHRRFESLRKLVVGAFPMVETIGLLFGGRLLADGFGWSRPGVAGRLTGSLEERPLVPEIEPVEGFGLPPAARVDLAEGMLRNMGLTRDFASIVLLCGHGGRSANNPYASSLDCGACGGHAGDVNARVAAAVLNDEGVRRGLAERGLDVPAETRFVAGLHDTTVDEVTLFEDDAVDAAAWATLVEWLSEAGLRTRAERSGPLGVAETGQALRERLEARANDWSEVRPEWGLAGNAAFIAAPRRRTRGVDLGGRVFLHDYEAADDEDGSVLELILAAPMVVASWINAQYYASTVDNDRFGSGDKTLHNVVARHGVMLGNRSDLRVGLPFQSVHDGEDFVHEPMRLLAIVEAPKAGIERVLAAHPEVARMVENDWIQLIAWDAEAGRFERCRGVDAGWEEVERPAGL